MTVSFDETLRESVYVSGGRVDSICEFNHGQLLLAIQNKNAILIVKNWIVVHQTEIEGNFAVSESMLLPEFESDSFPFMIEAGKKSYNLVNVKTGTRTILIRASAKLDVRQHGIRIKALDNGRFSMDFTVAQLNEIQGQENQFFTIQYNEDVRKLLLVYERLPPNKIEEVMDAVTNMNTPIFIMEGSSAREEVKVNRAETLRTDVKKMCYETRVLSKQNILLRRELK